MLKDIFYQGFYGIRPIPFAPVIHIANHDSDFGLAALQVDVVIRAVAYVFAVQVSIAKRRRVSDGNRSSAANSEVKLE